MGPNVISVPLSEKERKMKIKLTKGKIGKLEVSQEVIQEDKQEATVILAMEGGTSEGKISVAHLNQTEAEAISMEDSIIKEEADSLKDPPVNGVAEKITMKEIATSSRNMSNGTIIQEITLIMQMLQWRMKINRIMDTRPVILLAWLVPQRDYN